ncbi:sporulation protein SsgA, partial [Streptomyces sp. NPDC001914]
SLPSALCFGVRGDDATFALPEEVLEAGANPAAWGNKRKGYVYMVSAGVAEDLYANPARTFWTGPSGEYEKAAAWIVAQFAGVRPQSAGAVTEAAAERVAGQLFTHRHTRAGDPAPAAPAPALTEAQESAQAVAALVDAEDAELDVSAELPTANGSAALPDAKPSPDEARALLDELVDMVASIGPGTVAVKDFAPYLAQIGRDRSWVSKQLKQMAQGGRLAPTGEDGVYRLVPLMAGV